MTYFIHQEIFDISRSDLTRSSSLTTREKSDVMNFVTNRMTDGFWKKWRDLGRQGKFLVMSFLFDAMSCSQIQFSEQSKLMIISRGRRFSHYLLDHINLIIHPRQSFPTSVSEKNHTFQVCSQL